MKEIKYQICHFIHKDQEGDHVIHTTDETDEYYRDYSTQEMKADIERKTGLPFVNDEKKLIERKIKERKEGNRIAERFLILK